MPNSDTTTKFKADISQLKAAMQQAQRAVKLANSEFKAATAGLDDWSSSAEGLQAKCKQLNSTLDAQKKQVKLLEEQLEKTVKVYGENSAEADRARIALNNQQAAMSKTEKELNNYEKELDDCINGTGKFADELDEVDDASMTASDGFTVIKGALADLLADGIRLVIDGLKDLAKETITVGMNFESAMSKVQAISGASAEEMDLLREKAKEMGETTIFSATESAEAFNYMAMAGWKTEDMLNGIEGIMNLAAASGEDLATTSDIVTDALTAMGYSAGDAGKLADVMAAASSNANTNVSMMGETFQYAAPIVGALGYNMEDTAVAIGLMANAGIKGEKAGTALRSTLTRLSAPPKECAEAMDYLGISLTDSEGNMKSLDDVIGDLRKAFEGLSETEQTQYAKALAGQEAMSGLLAIVNAAPEDFDKLTEAVNNSNGAAESMANTMNDNVGGQITLLKSKVEGIMIKVFEKASNSIKGGITAISEALDKIDWDKVGEKVGNFAEKVLKLFTIIINNADGIFSILKSVGTVLVATFAINKIATFASTIVGLYNTFKTLKTATDAATASQKLLNLAQAATPIGLITAAVAGLATGLIYLAATSNDYKEVVANLTEEEQQQLDKVYEMSDAYADMKAARDESLSAINEEFNYYGELADELDTLVDVNGKIKEGYEDRANLIITTLNDALGTELSLTDGIIKNYQDEKAAIEDLINTKKAQAMLDANEGIYTEAIQHQNEVLQNLVETTNIYNDKVAELNRLEAEANRLSTISVEEYAKSIGMSNDLTGAADKLAEAQADNAEAQKETSLAIKEARDAMREADSTYVAYQATIKNYEGLSSAIISGDTEKINEALLNMQNDFVTAEIGTKESLENQVRNMENNYEELKKAIDSGSTVVTKEMVDDAKSMVDKSVKELEKFENKAETAGKNGSQAFADGAKNKSDEAKNAGKSLADNAVAGANEGVNGLSDAGENGATLFGTGISIKNLDAYAKGQALANQAKSGTESVDSTASGENFGEGFGIGIENKNTTVWNKAFNLAKNALGGLKKGQREGSPSKLTKQSGVYFGEGYEIGIDSMVKDVVKSAANMGISAYQSLRSAQQENSPSKLTYESGVNFVKGYINGIGSMQKQLVSSVKNTIGGALKIALSLDDYNFSEVANNVGTYFSDEISKKIDYTLNKINYQNKKKLEEFDNDIAKYQKLLNESESDYYKALYQKHIDEFNESKEVYQTASEEFINEFSNAINAYQTKAEALINATMSGISSSYEKRYDDLIDKQNNLISKLKSAGDLFSISGTGIMTVNDITEQTKQIKDYVNKLQSIKEKVSSDLFDKIATYDMKEGSAFIDRLLSMSESDLKAYSDAYQEKMNLSQQLGESTYKRDIEQVADDYEKTINTAFSSLPAQLEKIGADTMKGFVTGLISDTDYMDNSIKTLIKGMVNTFKNTLQIHSPSKVMERIGEYTGEGFGNGLKNMIAFVKDKASELAGSVVTPLTGFEGSIKTAKSNIGTNGFIGSQSTIVNNNYNLVQNNNSPKALSALETYRARRQQIAMMKAATQSM